MKLNFKDEKINEEKLVDKKIITFISWWQIFCLIGNLIQIFASFLSLIDDKIIFQSTEIFVGFSVMFAYFNIGRYFEFDSNYSIFYLIIKNSLGKVGSFLLGVTPIFLGFIFFGLCIFWKSERFTSFSDVIIVLFSLAQGDSIYSAFKDLSGTYFLIGQIYLYCFCILFIVVVLNIFIALIEESYINSRMEQKSHWVFDYIRYSEKKNNNKKSIIDDSNINNSHLSELKDQKNTENKNNQFNSLKESPFQLTLDSLKNSLNPKSIFFKGIENDFSYSKQRKLENLINDTSKNKRNLYQSFKKYKNKNDSLNFEKDIFLSLDKNKILYNNELAIKKDSKIKKRVSFQDDLFLKENLLNKNEDFLSNNPSVKKNISIKINKEFQFIMKEFKKIQNISIRDIRNKDKDEIRLNVLDFLNGLIEKKSVIELNLKD